MQEAGEGEEKSQKLLDGLFSANFQPGQLWTVRKLCLKLSVIFLSWEHFPWGTRSNRCFSRCSAELPCAGGDVTSCGCCFLEIPLTGTDATPPGVWELLLASWQQRSSTQMGSFAVVVHQWGWAGGWCLVCLFLSSFDLILFDCFYLFYYCCLFCFFK